VHNAYLLAWAETGLFGLLIYAGLLVVSLHKAWKHTRSKDNFTALMALGLGCAFLAMSIQMFADPFIARSLNIFVWMLIALIVSLDNLESPQDGSLVKMQVL
jgi:O-antigen ligase